MPVGSGAGVDEQSHGHTGEPNGPTTRAVGPLPPPRPCGRPTRWTPRCAVRGSPCVGRCSDPERALLTHPRIVLLPACFGVVERERTGWEPARVRAHEDPSDSAGGRHDHPRRVSPAFRLAHRCSISRAALRSLGCDERHSRAP
ncbi:DUF5954 family protein [Streptomyces sp. NPDC048384]|uniref:DUF5954 family protein n=1 Tax=Streptomyces sp. NPDC048384 TaxID=3155487 RepID=UPI00343CC906